MNLPKISVIMPVYNGELFLAASINSILIQTYRDFELIILNDNSTDNTKKIILEFQKKDCRIVYIEFNENKGPASLRNKGIEIANGDFIALNDADDISIINRFEEQVRLLNANENIGVCSSWYTTFGADIKEKLVKKPSESIDIFLKMLTFNCIGNSTVMFRKNILGEIKFKNEFVPCEDYKFWSELVQKTDFYTIKKPLLKYRLHENNISNTRIENVAISEKKIIVSLATNIFQIPEVEVDELLIMNLFKYKKNLSVDELTAILNYSKKIIFWNEISKKINSKQLKNRIFFLLTKSIKNGKINNLFINSLSKINYEYYKSLKFYQKINLYCRIFLR